MINFRAFWKTKQCAECTLKSWHKINCAFSCWLCWCSVLYLGSFFLCMETFCSSKVAFIWCWTSSVTIFIFFFAKAAYYPHVLLHSEVSPWYNHHGWLGFKNQWSLWPFEVQYCENLLHNIKRYDNIILILHPTHPPIQFVCVCFLSFSFHPSSYSFFDRVCCECKWGAKGSGSFLPSLLQAVIC